MAGISIRQYAKDCKCSDTAVHKAIKAGKIVKGLTYDENGRPKILPEIANREWGEFKETSAPVKPKPLAGKKEPIKQAPPVVEAPGSTVSDSTPTNNLAKARLAHTISKAKLAELDFQRKKGALVNKDQVYKALFAAGQEVRATFQAIPDRHIDEIFSAKTRNEAHEILYGVISKALETLADIGKRDLIPREA